MFRIKHLIILFIVQFSLNASANDLEKAIKILANSSSMGTYLADLEKEKQAIRNKYDLQLAQVMQQITKDTNAQLSEIFKEQVVERTDQSKLLKEDLVLFEQILALDTTIKNDLVFLLKNQAALLDASSAIVSNLTESQKTILDMMQAESVNIDTCTDEICVRFSGLDTRLTQLKSAGQDLASATSELRSYLTVSLKQISEVNEVIAKTKLEIQRHEIEITVLNENILKLQ